MALKSKIISSKPLSVDDLVGRPVVSEVKAVEKPIEKKNIIETPHVAPAIPVGTPVSTFPVKTNLPINN